MSLTKQLSKKLKLCEFINTSKFPTGILDIDQGSLALIVVCLYNNQGKLEWPSEWNKLDMGEDMKKFFKIFEAFDNGKHKLPYTPYTHHFKIEDKDSTFLRIGKLGDVIIGFKWLGDKTIKLNREVEVSGSGEIKNNILDTIILKPNEEVILNPNEFFVNLAFENYLIEIRDMNNELIDDTNQLEVYHLFLPQEWRHYEVTNM